VSYGLSCAVCLYVLRLLPSLVGLPAKLAYVAASEWIRDPLARTCLLDLLRRTETATGWPWGYVVGKLGRDWGLGPGVG
jgi:hypothetical protein